MDVTSEMMVLGVELAEIIGRKSVETIWDRIKTVKQTGNKEQIINRLEEIINELIADKNSLIQISQAYEEKLITQKITETEIDYITQSVIPLLEDFITQSGEDDGKIQIAINVLKPLLSKETFNIMQILGFNFKKAVGEPLTELLASYIRANVKKPVVDGLTTQMMEMQKEIEYLKICQDEDAFKRLISIFQPGNN